MSMNKFTSIFFRQIEAFGVYYPSNIYEARENEWLPTAYRLLRGMQRSLVRLYQQTNISLLL